MAVSDKITQIRDLNELRLLLAQDDAGLGRYVFSRLRLGDVWWIPDSVSGFGGKERHPWVIVQGHSERRANVIACPRTTSTKNRNDGLVVPAGILPDLDKEGLFVLRHRRAFLSRDFRDFMYIGQLPQVWIRQIQDFYTKLRTKRPAR